MASKSQPQTMASPYGDFSVHDLTGSAEVQNAEESLRNRTFYDMKELREYDVTVLPFFSEADGSYKWFRATGNHFFETEVISLTGTPSKKIIFATCNKDTFGEQCLICDAITKAITSGEVTRQSDTIKRMSVKSAYLWNIIPHPPSNMVRLLRCTFDLHRQISGYIKDRFRQIVVGEQSLIVEKEKTGGKQFPEFKVTPGNIYALDRELLLQGQDPLTLIKREGIGNALQFVESTPIAKFGPDPNDPKLFIGSASASANARPAYVPGAGATAKFLPGQRVPVTFSNLHEVEAMIKRGEKYPCFGTFSDTAPECTVCSLKETCAEEVVPF